MKSMIVSSIALLCVAFVATGCATSNRNRQSAAGATPGVLDVSPAPVASSTPAAYAPPVAPVAPAQPVMDATVVAPAAPAAAGGASYKVQKGDTLWKIASSQYGDGKQWQKICSANPGLTPETLKAGQTITIP